MMIFVHSCSMFNSFLTFSKLALLLLKSSASKLRESLFKVVYDIMDSVEQFLFSVFKVCHFFFFLNSSPNLHFLPRTIEHKSIPYIM